LLSEISDTSDISGIPGILYLRIQARQLFMQEVPKRRYSEEIFRGDIQSLYSDEIFRRDIQTNPSSPAVHARGSEKEIFRPAQPSQPSPASPSTGILYFFKIPSPVSPASPAHRPVFIFFQNINQPDHP